MPPWYTKAAIQGVLSLLPQSHRWNYVFQRNVSKRLRLNVPYFESRVKACAQHLLNYKTYASGTPRSIVELGTGWHLLVPLGLYLSGVENIVSVDITPLMRNDLVRETFQHFIKYSDEDRLRSLLPDLQSERVDVIRAALKGSQAFNAPLALGKLGIATMVADASQVRLQNIDLVVSNTTLEHIPGPVIEAIFRNFHQFLAADGLMSHLIDLSDHYSHTDRRLTPYHFLQFSPLAWRLFNNSLQYQNRLRVSDYREIHQRSGFKLLHEESTPAAADLIDQVKIAPEFQHYSREDLIVTSSWMVSRPS